MAMTIKIAPDLEEIKREGNVLSCEFNNMHIKWAIADDCSDLDEENERRLKGWLQAGIGMSGKMWQLPFFLNKNLPFASEIYVNGERVEWPKE